MERGLGTLEPLDRSRVSTGVMKYTKRCHVSQKSPSSERVFLCGHLQSGVCRATHARSSCLNSHACGWPSMRLATGHGKDKQTSYAPFAIHLPPDNIFATHQMSFSTRHQLSTAFWMCTAIHQQKPAEIISAYKRLSAPAIVAIHVSKMQIASTYHTLPFDESEA